MRIWVSRWLCFLTLLEPRIMDNEQRCLRFLLPTVDFSWLRFLHLHRMKPRFRDKNVVLVASVGLFLHVLKPQITVDEQRLVALLSADCRPQTADFQWLRFSHFCRRHLAFCVRNAVFERSVGSFLHPLEASSRHVYQAGSPAAERGREAPRRAAAKAAR